MLTFEAYTQVAHGYPPHPWQSRLAAELHTIDVLHAPTSAGKTGVLDAWLWRLASEASWPRAKRLTPIRLVVVIDRRMVVDSITQHARCMQQALEKPELACIKQALSSYGGAANPLVTPLVISRLRGGIETETDWMQQPHQPAIIISTVDQVGSRLLFRGYGQSRRRWPIEAGLLGNDTLIVCDEAHLSTPFVETVRAVEKHRQGQAVMMPWRFIEMSATSRSTEGKVFAFQDEDWLTPRLQARLTRPKRARLVETNAKLETAMIEAARELEGDCIAVIANTVDSARAIYHVLNRDKHSDATLLIGRIREHERSQLQARWLPCLQAGGKGVSCRTYVVATQTIEVGADLDFDGMVTQIAPLSALIQRLGRVNRLGCRDASQVAIVATTAPDDKAQRRADRVYSGESYATWVWLSEHAYQGLIDLCPRSIHTLIEAHGLPVETVRHAPPFTAGDIARLSQTSLEHRDDIAARLHGPERSANVTLVWRDDVELTEDACRGIELVPPLAAEGAEIPVYSVQQWLNRAKADPVADLDGIGIYGGGVSQGREIIRYSEDTAQLISPGCIKPGDTLIAPSSYGGHDVYGWAPDSDTPVKDIADRVYEERKIVRRRLTLKKLENLIPDEELAKRATDTVYSYREVVNQLEQGGTLEVEIEDALHALQAVLTEVGLWTNGDRITRYLDGVLVSGGRRLIVDEESLLLGQGVVPLDEHLADVGQRARLICDALGLPLELASDCELAAALHDIGKADWRFQLVLGGDASMPLAKSLRDRDELKRADAGLPKGWRHEVVSAEMLNETDGQDVELVRHLVATHHGHCRPLPPLVDHGEEPLTYAGRTRRRMEPRQWLSQWNTVIQRYGAWGVAYLEAIVRLADWAASREPQAMGERPRGSRISQPTDLQSTEQMTLF